MTKMSCTTLHHIPKYEILQKKKKIVNYPFNKRRNSTLKPLRNVRFKVLLPKLRRILHSNLVCDIFLIPDLNCSGAGTDDRNGPFPQFNHRWWRRWRWLCFCDGENVFWRDRKRFKKCRDLQRATTAISSEQKETVKDFSCSQTQTKCWHRLVRVSGSEQSWDRPFCRKILEVCGKTLNGVNLDMLRFARLPNAN